jgi:hypothetical protein
LIASIGGWAALTFTGNLSLVFLALSVALATFGIINAIAIWRGAWFADAPQMVSNSAISPKSM